MSCVLLPFTPASAPSFGWASLTVCNGVQVEHGITEMVNRVDLVAWQLKLQCPGFKVGRPLNPPPAPQAHCLSAVTCRVLGSALVMLLARLALVTSHAVTQWARHAALTCKA